MVQRVKHGACAEEEQRLEKCMGGEVIHGRCRAGHSHGHDHVTELRQRRAGENAFDVVLLDGHQRGQQRRDAADPGNHLQRRGVENEKDAAQHVNARCHHGRRMNQRADRRGALHRVRQPDVQRKLRRLAHRAAEDKQSGDRCHRAEQRRVLSQRVFDQ